MRVKVKVPQQGLTIEEVVIGEFCVGVGDWVVKDQKLLSIESDKAVLDVEAPVDGVVTELLVEEGDDAPIGAGILVIETNV